jgi:hypothetical protein
MGRAAGGFVGLDRGGGDWPTSTHLGDAPLHATSDARTHGILTRTIFEPFSTGASAAPAPASPTLQGRIAQWTGANMTHRVSFKYSQAAAPLVLAASILGSPASAQSSPDVVGTWSLVSSVTEKDGVKTEQFGPGAKGMLVLDSAGHFMLTIIGPELPKFASNNRAGGTPEENKAVVSRSIAMIGDYSVNAAEKTLTFKVDRATFPNWNGTEQKRLLSPLADDELKYVTPTASSGGVGTVTWRRVR